MMMSNDGPNSHPTSMNELRTFFLSAFSSDELKTFIRANYSDLEASVHFDDTPEQVADEVAGVLIRHGAVDPDFFDALSAKRPRREDEIRELESLFISTAGGGEGDKWAALPRRAHTNTERGIVTLAMQLDREKQWKYLTEAHQHRHVLFML